MVVQRTPTTTKSILLSDYSSRLLLQIHFAKNARSTSPAEDGVMGMAKPTTPSKPMAPRRKKAPPPQLAMAFRCPSCDHAVDSVECRIGPKGKKVAAEASCWNCEATYTTTGAHALMEPVDVYCEWIDELERPRRSSASDRTATATW